MVRRTEDDRFRVISLSAAGKTQSAIVRETGFPRKFVKRWFGRHDPNDAPHPGRVPKLTPPTVATVRSLMKGKRRRSTRKVAALLREKKGIELSKSSVWTAAHRAGLTAYHKQRKPLLTAEHRMVGRECPVIHLSRALAAELSRLERHRASLVSRPGPRLCPRPSDYGRAETNHPRGVAGHRPRTAPPARGLYASSSERCFGR